MSPAPKGVDFYKICDNILATLRFSGDGADCSVRRITEMQSAVKNAIAAAAFAQTGLGLAVVYRDWVCASAGR